MSEGEIAVSPEVVCIGDTITFTVSGVADSGGVKTVDCYTSEPIDPVTPDFTWEIARPIPLDSLTGSGSSASVVAFYPGVYSCTFTATADRDCPPGAQTIGPASKTLTFSATLTLDPSSIAASTVWPDIAPGLNRSDISVTWNPPECEGTLQIVEVVGDGGYVPPGEGALEGSGTSWHYTAFNEPAPVACEKPVKVWIAAFKGDVELPNTRKSILVWPVHTFLTTGANADFWSDFWFLLWKYGDVLGTSGGMFTGVDISADACVPCDGNCVAACTDLWNDTVRFGTDAFTSSENQAASIIGHELVHTLSTWPYFQTECQAYTWEAYHAAETGILPCDLNYFREVVDRQAEKCPQEKQKAE